MLPSSYLTTHPNHPPHPPPPPKTKVITVGLGSPANARAFAAALGYPTDDLYADPTGDCYKALAFSPGFAEGVGVDPYLKLLPMLMGIGSPGTVQEVGRAWSRAWGWARGWLRV